MKSMNVVRKYGPKISAGVSLFVAGTTIAFADATVAAADIDSGKSDVELIGYSVLGVFVLVFLLKSMRRTM